jgi:hypothetical protein
VLGQYRPSVFLPYQTLARRPGSPQACPPRRLVQVTNIIKPVNFIVLLMFSLNRWEIVQKGVR